MVLFKKCLSAVATFLSQDYHNDWHKAELNLVPQKHLTD